MNNYLLPKEIIREIYKYYPIRQKCDLFMTCKHYHKMYDVFISTIKWTEETIKNIPKQYYGNVHVISIKKKVKFLPNLINLQELRFEDDYGVPIDPDNIPPNIKIIKVGNSYGHDFDDSFFRSFDKLECILRSWIYCFPGYYITCKTYKYMSLNYYFNKFLPKYQETWTGSSFRQNNGHALDIEKIGKCDWENQVEYFVFDVDYIYGKTLGEVNDFIIKNQG